MSGTLINHVDGVEGMGMEVWGSYIGGLKEQDLKIPRIRVGTGKLGVTF